MGNNPGSEGGTNRPSQRRCITPTICVTEVGRLDEATPDDADTIQLLRDLENEMDSHGHCQY
jgi:hypothetical protein